MPLTRRSTPITAEEAEAAQRLRSDAEARVARMRATLPPNMDMATLLHELQVYRVELELQNDELRRTQQLLEGARDRYRDLYEFAPVGCLALDRGENVVEVNHTATQLFGLPRSALVGMRFALRLADDSRDDWHRLARRLWRDGGSGQVTLSIIDAGGLPKPVRLDLLHVAQGGEEPSLRVAVTQVSPATPITPACAAG